METETSGGILAIAQKHAEFLEFLKKTAADIPQTCPNDSGASSGPTVSACNPNDTDPNRSSLKFSFLIPANGNQPDSLVKIPLGASVLSYNQVRIGEWYYDEVIYLYQQQYFYVSECTGIRANRLLLANAINRSRNFEVPFNWFNVKFDILAKPSKLLCKGPLQRAMKADNLTTLLKCVPNAENFKRVSCLSQDLLAQLFTTWVFI